MTMQTAIKHAVLLVVIIVCLIYTLRLLKKIKSEYTVFKKK